MDFPFPELIRNVGHILSTGAGDWGSLHPLLVHFPVALIFIVPVFILLGFVFPKSSKTFYFCALLLLSLGTLSLLAAITSGEAASEPLNLRSEAAATLNRHYHLAEQSQWIFCTLLGLFTVYFFLFDSWLAKFRRRVHALILFLYLLFYGYGLAVLLNAAHQGGKLVHSHSVKSNLYLPKK